MMNDRIKLLKEISTVDFAMIELHLFLDTHPDDNAASAKLEEYKLKSKELTREYEKKYGPLSANSRNADRWAWISSYWPWDRTSSKEAK